MGTARSDSTCVATVHPTRRFPAPWGLLLAALGGCATSAAPPPAMPVVAEPAPARRAPSAVHERGRDKLIVEVGEAGGTLELMDGARVDIPAGALTAPVSFTFAVGQHTTAFDNREYEQTLGRTLELAPAVGVALPVVVSIPLAQLPQGYEPADLTLATEVPADHQRNYQDHATQTRWDYLQARHVDGRAEATLNYVPGMRLQFLVSGGE